MISGAKYSGVPLKWSENVAASFELVDYGKLVTGKTQISKSLPESVRLVTYYLGKAEIHNNSCDDRKEEPTAKLGG